jgi:hypothetical protein
MLIKIRERQAIIAERLVSGVSNTMEDYKLRVGKLQGLKEAEEIVQQMYKSMFETVNSEGVKEDDYEEKGSKFY